MKVFKIRAEIKMIPIYDCLECGRSQAGTTTSMSLETTEITQAIKSARAPMHGMPVGWASYHDGFRCEGCKK